MATLNGRRSVRERLPYLQEEQLERNRLVPLTSWTRPRLECWQSPFIDMPDRLVVTSTCYTIAARTPAKIIEAMRDKAPMPNVVTY